MIEAVETMREVVLAATYNGDLIELHEILEELFNSVGKVSHNRITKT